MTDPELSRLDGSQTMAILDEIQVAYHVAFPEYDLDDHRRRTTNQARARGFSAITAREDGDLVGFVYGLPLQEGTTWWDGLEPAGPAGFVTETGARTFAVIDLAVLPAVRGRSLGRRLLRELLGSRPDASQVRIGSAPRIMASIRNQALDLASITLAQVDFGEGGRSGSAAECFERSSKGRAGQAEVPGDVDGRGRRSAAESLSRINGTACYHTLKFRHNWFLRSTAKARSGRNPAWRSICARLSPQKRELELRPLPAGSAGAVPGLTAHKLKSAVGERSPLLVGMAV